MEGIKVILKESERDRIIGQLSTKQQQFLENHVKRGKRSKFANEMAKLKGIRVTETMTDEEIERLLEEWILLDFIDAGQVSNDLRCQCGRALRYQYVVKNLKTGDILRFGREHFQEHTKLPASMVKQVLKGLEEIDYERDEILYKVDQGWSFVQVFSFFISEMERSRSEAATAELNGPAQLKFPEKLSIPQRLQEHVDSGLPLLDGQIRKLQQLIQEYLDQRNNPLPQLPPSPMKATKNRSATPLNKSFSHAAKRSTPQESAHSRKEIDVQTEGKVDLFSFQTDLEENQPISGSQGASFQKANFYQEASSYQETNSFESAIQGYLAEGIESVRVICELLIKHQAASQERYATGKPKIYVAVCRYIEELDEEGIYQLVQSNQQDRQFRKR